MLEFGRLVATGHHESRQNGQVRQIPEKDWSG